MDGELRKTAAQRRQTVILEEKLADLEAEIRFDHRLKENYMMKENDEAKEAAVFQKKYLSKIKNIAIFVYYIVIPFMQTPDWCTNAWAAYNHENGIKGYRFAVTYDCASVANGIQFSGFPNLSPLVTGTIDIACLVALCAFRCYKERWRRMSKKNIWRTWALCFISALSTADNIYSICKDNYPFFSDFMKPVVVMIFASSIRGTFMQVASNARDSITVILTIFIFIGFYTITGFYLYRGTL